MSSLAATQADGYYLPPEYFESGAHKKQSKNAYYRKQQQQKRNSSDQTNDPTEKKLRFELPYPGLCTACGSFIPRGTRYNATKQEKGKYFTTPIYEFRFTCRVVGCTCPFVVCTDPQNRGFAYKEGIVRASTRNDTDEKSSHRQEEEELDVVEQLEETKAGQRQAARERDELRSIKHRRQQLYEKDADSNARVRATFRSDRHVRKRQASRGEQLGWRRGMSLLDSESIPSDKDDHVHAKSNTYGDGRRVEKTRLGRLRQSSIFSSTDKKTRRHDRTKRHRLSAPAEPQDDAPPGKKPTKKIRLVTVTAASASTALKPVDEKPSRRPETTDEQKAEEAPTQPPPSSALAALADYDSD